MDNLTLSQWSKLPLYLRQKFWKETKYGKHAPSAELMAEITSVLDTTCAKSTTEGPGDAEINERASMYESVLTGIGCIMLAGVAAFILFWIGFWIVHHVQQTLTLIAATVVWASYMLWRSRD